MKDDFINSVHENKNAFFDFFVFLVQKDKNLLVKGDILDFYREYSENFTQKRENLLKILGYIQEAAVFDQQVFFDVRTILGASKFYVLNLDGHYIETISAKESLIAKEKFVGFYTSEDLVTLNFKPFYEKSPLVRDRRNIGHGVEYLNRYLSSTMFNDIEKWKGVLFEFIKLHKYDGRQLVLNDRISDPDQLSELIDKAVDYLFDLDEEIPYQEIKHKLQEMGFEPGLGGTAGEIYKNLNLLDNLLNSPDHIVLKEFISNIPMIFNVAIISPHGFFGQEGVLGLPDTGGQVVYILDQVKALERALVKTLEKAGIEVRPKIIILTRLIPNAGNTTCNQRIEKVHETENVWILRVPFKEHNKKYTDNWMSRFEIWPYLEEFAESAAIELKAEFGRKPDLVIGNYSDGNLVAYKLSEIFGVTQCCIAHALEKSKYLYSALYWKDMEQNYHFSLQFTADLIAINSADFLITSSFQEIAGTEDSIGQYESYRHFTMPGLYRVENGVNPRHTKFNILSPGVNRDIYFPYYEKDKRISGTIKKLSSLIFGNAKNQNAFGQLEKPDKIPVFTMARLDKIKNITGLVEWFGSTPSFRQKCNLIVVAGKVNPAFSNDREEIEQIRHMYQLIDEYDLYGNLRWLGILFNKKESGEIYRIIADRQGLFVQPALFEGFGLTVLEAMISGLVVFATRYGGPLEIIQNNKSGFHIDPVNKNVTTNVFTHYLERYEKNADIWKKMSDGAIKRVQERYNWELYTDELLSLAKIYGFWKFSTDMERADMEAYLDLFYHTVFKPRARELLEQHNRDGQ
ncbi:sucrose synthase [candidate division KSB1 bacterium]|nr:sucrose synthase [candidate division KSB1 bacterium]